MSPILQKKLEARKRRMLKPVKPELRLVGTDGNAFALLGAARRVAIKNGLDWASIQSEAMSGDYDHLLSTLMKHFDVC